MIDGEVIAPGFELYSPDSDMGQINDKWLVTGCLPSDGVWQNVSHYELEDALVENGFLHRSQCDSESGQFFVYLSDEAQARAVGEYIRVRLEAVETMRLNPLRYGPQS